MFRISWLRDRVEGALSTAWIEAGLNAPTSEQWDTVCEFQSMTLAEYIQGAMPSSLIRRNKSLHAALKSVQKGEDDLSLLQEHIENAIDDHNKVLLDERKELRRILNDRINSLTKLLTKLLDETDETKRTNALEKAIMGARGLQDLAEKFPFIFAGGRETNGKPKF